MYNRFTIHETVLNTLLTSLRLYSYIIDLEDARQLDDDCPPKVFTPERDFHLWGIAGPEINTGSFGLDPMVPHDGEFIKDPSDEELEKMARDAAGKPLYFWESNRSRSQQLENTSTGVDGSS